MIFNFAFLTIECGLDVEDPTPPSPPVWVQKSLPEEWPERGIDAHETGGIYLEWEVNLEDNISAYLIFRAEYYDHKDSLGEYKKIYRKPAEINVDMEYVDTDIKANIKYYYELRAEDLSENLSPYSDSQFYKILPQISLSEMGPNDLVEILGPERSLNWHTAIAIEVEEYCLTVLTQENDLVLRTVFNPSNYINGYETWHIPNSISLTNGRIYKWRIDTNANYFDGVETVGSESPWAYFHFSEPKKI